MSDRCVTHVSRNEDGDIMALCNPGELWSPRTKKAAMEDIQNGLHRYYVLCEVDIQVVRDPDGPYLRTRPDWTDKDNLAALPDIEKVMLVS